MTNCNRKLFLAMIVAVTIFGLFLYGCGGGGGGGGTPDAYTGETSQAVITEDNAQTIVVDSAEGVYNMQEIANENSNFTGIGMVISKSSGISAGEGTLLLAKKAINLIKNSDMSKTEKLYLGENVKISETDSCSCGGKISLGGNISGDEDSADFDLKMDFNSCCEDGAVMNGIVKASGNMKCEDKDCEEGSFNMNMTFNNMTVTGDYNESGSFNGTVKMSSAFTKAQYGITIAQAKMTMDVVLTDNVANKTLWIDDLVFNVKIDNYNDESAFDMDGRFYNSDYGYIDMQTRLTFKANDYNDNPYEGVLVVEGKDNTKARLTCLSAYTYKVEADTNGDGSYDYSTGTLYWD